MRCPKPRFPIQIILFDKLELIIFVSQGLTLSTASLVQSFNSAFNLQFILRNKCHLTKKAELGKYKPTHVVTAITYGGDAHIEFRKVKKKKIQNHYEHLIH